MPGLILGQFPLRVPQGLFCERQFLGFFLYYASPRQQPAALSALINTLRL